MNKSKSDDGKKEKTVASKNVEIRVIDDKGRDKDVTFKDDQQSESTKESQATIKKSPKNM